MKSSKGFYYSLDAVVALFLILTLIIVMAYTPSSQNTFRHLPVISEDLLTSLSVIKVSDSQNPLILQKIANNEINHREQDMSLLGYITELWAQGETPEANLIIKNLTTNLPIKGIEVSVKGDILYQTLSGNKEIIASSSKIITGVSEVQTQKGISVRSYLTGIGNKLTSDFVFFGGFVGQGNITKLGLDLPADANITIMTFETILGDNATLYINNNFCTNLNKTSNNRSKTYNIINCNNSIVTGENKFDITFEDVDTAYVGGGLIEVKYTTKETVQSNKKEYLFPGIDGIVNLYSSLLVKGNLNSLNTYLHFDIDSSSIGNATFYVKLGNTTIYENDSISGETIVNIDNSEMSSLFNYEDFSNQTIPIRVGFNDLDYKIESSTGNADVILITDFSGSMKKSVSDWSQGNLGGTCEDAYADPTTRRTKLAQCLDKDFVTKITEISGNRIWPVFMHNNEIKYFDDPTNTTGINEYIDSYNNGAGKTCVSCAVNTAHDILDTYSNDERQKFIIVMTDGVPTDCADGSCFSTSQIFGVNQCDGLCDVNGQNCGDPIADQCSECTTNDGAIDNTIFSSNRTHDLINSTIHSIGFGPITDCEAANSTLHKIAEIGNGTYSHSNNVTELIEIYDTLAEQIITATITSQIITIEGGTENFESKLFADSKIEYTTTQTPIDTTGKVNINYISDKFNSCTTNINLPNSLLIDSQVTSFSAEHWTDKVIVNSKNIFNLSKYSNEYQELGDPFVLFIPPDKLTSGNNIIEMNIGDTPTNSSGCSLDSRLNYEILIDTSFSMDEIYLKAEGCLWNITYYDNTIGQISVPIDYTGSKTCSLSSYDSEDAIDNSVYQLLNKLDIDNDGKIDIKFDENNFEIETIQINEIPDLVGPSKIMVKIWQ